MKRGSILALCFVALALPLSAQVRVGRIGPAAHANSGQLRSQNFHSPMMGDPSGGRALISPSIGIQQNHFRNGTFGGHACLSGVGCRHRFARGIAYPFWSGPIFWPNDFDYDNEFNARDVVNQQQHIISELEDEASQRRYYEMRQQERADSQSALTPERTASDAPQADPPTRLIFKDRHYIDVYNYAVLGNAVHVLGSRTIATMTIPLTELDVPATVKANMAQGIDFHVPD